MTDFWGYRRYLFIACCLSIQFLVTQSGLTQSHADQQKVKSKHYNELAAKANSYGTVRVIVRVKSKKLYTPGRKLSSKAAKAQGAENIKAQEKLIERMQTHSVIYAKKLAFIPFTIMDVNAEALDALNNDPDVLSIHRNGYFSPSLEDSVPLIGADAVWDLGFTGKGQVIAVLDTGIDGNHTFLANKIIHEVCYSSNDNGASSLCPNGMEFEEGEGAGINCPLYISGCAHGTHVAGIAAGIETDFSGVARDASLLSIQVSSKLNDPAVCDNLPAPCARVAWDNVLQALNFVWQFQQDHSNIAAVNMSLVDEQNHTVSCDTVQDFVPISVAIGSLHDLGVPSVIASGNEHYVDGMNAPACISEAVSVGATTGLITVGNTTIEQITYNNAPFLDLLAPGFGINSSVPGGGFQSKGGTSMATPHVAGAWAVIKEASPDSSVDEVLALLKNTGTSIVDTRPNSNNNTKPRIEVLDAIMVIPPEVLQNVTVYAGETFEHHAAMSLIITGEDEQSNSTYFIVNGNGVYGGNATVSAGY